VDTSPIDYVPPPEAGTAEAAAADAPDTAALVPACRTCLTEGACMSQTQTCLNDARCSQFVNCLVDAYCLNYSLTDLAHLPACVTTCSSAAGIQVQSDPVIAIFIPVFACAQGPGMCAAECDVQ
jgi:hypothetical protein